MNKITFPVYRKDIKRGRKNDCWACPVALAIYRATGRKASVFDRITFKDNNQEYRISTQLYKWILDFDESKPVQARSFTIYPQEKVTSHHYESN